ncbi:MAG: T6SS immunity protein Tdi1 domain-containing protein [Bacteroidia bacterium]|jgi:hypothetical protein
MTATFLDAYRPDANNMMATEELIQKYSSKVPPMLIALWKSSGLGKYNDGLIELIDPEKYEPVLWTWLGKEVSSYVPFAITGFGEILYYRKLIDGAEDVCMLDMQFRTLVVLTWSFEDFLNDFLLQSIERSDWLREELFIEAVSKFGKPCIGEVFTFVPLPSFGGAMSIEYIQKGNAIVYQHLVFSMTA